MTLGSNLRVVLSLLLACLWITTASSAEHVAAEFPLCQPAHSPCCPQPANNTSESCPACHTSDPVAEKKTVEQEREQEELKCRLRTQTAIIHQANPSLTAARRELTAGFRYQPMVFDLKDDLRI